MRARDNDTGGRSVRQRGVLHLCLCLVFAGLLAGGGGPGFAGEPKAGDQLQSVADVRMEELEAAVRRHADFLQHPRAETAISLQDSAGSDLKRRLYDRLRSLGLNRERIVAVMAVVLVLGLIFWRLRRTSPAPHPPGNETATGRIKISTGKGVALSTGILLVGLAGLEVYARYNDVPLYTMKGIWTLDQYALITPVPNLRNKEQMIPRAKQPFFVSTNADGFRGQDIKVEREPDVIRILVVGYSYSFGWGIDDAQAWPAQLERALNDAKVFPLRVEIANAAVNGATNGYLRYYGRGAKYNPDIIICELPLGGDIGLSWADDEGKRHWLKPDPEFADKSPYYIDSEERLRIRGTHPVERHIIQHSGLYRMIKRQLNVGEGGGPGPRVAAQPRAEPPKDLRLQRDFPTLVRFSDDMKKENRAFIAMINVPSNERWKSLSPADAQGAFDAIGVPLVDLRPTFAALPVVGYSVEDGHWNGLGSAITAKRMLDFLFAHRDPILETLRERARLGLAPLSLSQVSPEP